MIGSRQIMPKMPIGAEESPFVAYFHNGSSLTYADSILMPWAIFGTCTLTKCYGGAASGTFTAEISIDGVLSFTVTESDTTTPVSLTGMATGVITNFGTVTCVITAASSPVNLFIRCTE